MRALLGVRHHGTTAVLLAVVSLICVLTLASTGTAIAKTRPPIEMGDPDGTNDQGPKSGSSGARAPLASTKQDLSLSSSRFNVNDPRLRNFGPYGIVNFAWRWMFRR